MPGAPAPSGAAAHGAKSPVQFPLDVPVFPLQPVGVFQPGSTRSLHLYEAHFVSMVEEALSTPHKLMCTAVLEPYMGGDDQTSGLGSYKGGQNQVLSCACLVKVLEARPYPGGYLVRIRGEARVGISELLQMAPYMRVRVHNLPDQMPHPANLPQLESRVAELDSVMRGVQMLASKFRCDETACIQQAFRYVNELPLVPAVIDSTTGSSSSSSCSGGENVGAQAASSNASPASSQPASSHIRSVNGQEAAAGSEAGSSQVGSPSQQQQQAPLRGAQAAQQQQQHSRGHQEEEQEEPFDVQRAARLSYASLQWLPESSNEEKIAVLRGRLLAMECLSLEERVEVAIEVMGEASARLAAKCAIMSMGR